jgi:hypothetical protein
MVTIVLVAVPFWTSLTYIISWQLGITDWLRVVNASTTSSSKYSLLALFITGLGYLAWRYHLAVRLVARTAILVMSPLIVFGAVTVVRAGYLEPTLAIHAKTTPEERPGASRHGSVFVLLFDELDYGFLYKDGEVRPDFPNIGAFASKADNYHKAFSPGSDTLIAMPGLLVGRKVNVNAGEGLSLYEVSNMGTMSPLNLVDTSIFSLARDRGFATVMFGWMFPYCELLKRQLEECQAVSIYNYATVNDSFSIVNPIFTNIVLGPHQVPLTGHWKTLIYSHFHHRAATKIYNLAVSILDTKRPVFEFVHFNLPHSPFVYDGAQYAPASDPWLQNEENYVKQLKYVDLLVGRFLAELEQQASFATSDIIILSDHGYRAMAPKGQAYHVPLLIKRAGQVMRRDHDAPVQTEVILRGLVNDTADTGLEDRVETRRS